MDDTTKKLHGTTDAMVWAEEWCRIAREIEAADDGRQIIDEGWMVGWFANAIETGRNVKPDPETSPALLDALSKLGGEYGPLGVALVAARMTDPTVLVARLGRQNGPPYDHDNPYGGLCPGGTSADGCCDECGAPR